MWKTLTSCIHDQCTPHRAPALFLAAKKKSAVFNSFLTKSSVAATGRIMHPNLTKIFDVPTYPEAIMARRVKQLKTV